MGNCSSFKAQIPHSCKKDPVIADLTLDQAGPENMTEGCCRGGSLFPSFISPSNSFSSFEMQVGTLEGNNSARMPRDLTLMAPGPGYTCGPLSDVDPTVSSDIGGRRQVPVFSKCCSRNKQLACTWFRRKWSFFLVSFLVLLRWTLFFSGTWKTSCTYSSFLANKAPMCCVSLSTFYNPTVTSCPKCSCGCKDADNNAASCIRYRISRKWFVVVFDVGEVNLWLITKHSSSLDKQKLGYFFAKLCLIHTWQFRQDLVFDLETNPKKLKSKKIPIYVILVACSD